jgi:hypothetical protein
MGVDAGPRISEHGFPHRRPTHSQVAKRWIVPVALVILIVIEAFLGHPEFLALIGAIVVVVGFTLFVGSTYSQIRCRGGEFRGQLLVSWRDDSIPGTDVFPRIERVERSRRSQLGRQGLSGGKLTIRSDGLVWHGGSLATPSQVTKGQFFIPWVDISNIDIGDVPMKLRVLGGAINIQLAQSRGSLEGQFLGSHRRIVEVLLKTPLSASG